MSDLQINGQNPVQKTQIPTEKGVRGGGQSPEINLKEAKVKTSEEAFEASGLKITKEDVKSAQGELGIRTSAKTKERIANMHNNYAQKFLSACEGAPAEFKALAMQYAQELPKASRGHDIQDYKAACEAKLDAFRSAARDMGMLQFLGEMEENADDRFVQGEVTADLRADQLAETTVNTGKDVIAKVNAHTDEKHDETQAVVKDEGQKGRAETRRQGAKTRRTMNQGFAEQKRFIKSETDRGISANAQNASAMLGVDAEGYTVENEDGDRVLYNDNVVADKDSAVGKNLHNMRVIHGVDSDNNPIKDGVAQRTTDGRELQQENTTLDRMNKTRDAVNKHTTEETNRAIDDNRAQHKETRQAVQDNNVLQAKRQTLSDMLGHEDRENFGVYRDSTVKWLGGSADKILSNNKLNQKQKEEALDELVRMVDEENIISDGDKEEFNKKYKLQ